MLSEIKGKKYIKVYCICALLLISIGFSTRMLLEKPIFTKEVQAEEESILCEDTEEIELPGINEYQPLAQNMREIPVGRSTDFTEKMAGDLIEWSLNIAVAAQAEVNEAQEVLSTSRQCGESGVCKSDCDLIPGDDCGEPCVCHYESGWLDGCLWGTNKCEDHCDALYDCEAAGNICCCDGEPDRCINDECTGNCAATAAQMKPGIEDIIIPQARVVDDNHNKMEVAYFMPRFYPLLLYNEQYGIFINGGKVEEPTKDDVRNYLSQYVEVSMGGWLDTALSSVEEENKSWEELGLSGWDRAARYICRALTDEHEVDYCITPLEYHTSVEKEANGEPKPFVFGYLDKTRIRMSECVSEPYLEEAVLRGEKSVYEFIGCRDITNTGITVHSFIEEDGLNEEGQPLNGGPIEGCYGYYYGRSMEREGITPRYPAPNADDFYCCSF